ncbi:hypothetical protein [Acetobacter estunensis]|uniref:hypothetical protein n=1 Tax=Acetobacter estunensis TaxID=104097 RepID=UPI001C2D2710|nr:hypothetical protein [Acetobacter estunensis]MBV1837661.1 hypothetical protein [Acetobacter estunensis]
MSEDTPQKQPPTCGVSSSTKGQEHVVDENSEDSFPASDPPGSGQVTGANDCVHPPASDGKDDEVE